MARRKAKTNVKKTTTNVSTTVAAAKNTNNSMIKDPGGKEEDAHLNNKVLTNNRTNGVSVSSFLKATKDQLITSSTSSNATTQQQQQQQQNSNISSTTANTTSGLTFNNTTTTTTNDSKYLHKKFKKFCATVDSNQTNNNNNNNISFNQNTSSSHNSDRTLTTSGNIITTNSSATTTTTATTTLAVVATNNNSEIVENKNGSSWISQQQQQHRHHHQLQPQDTTSLTNYNNHHLQHHNSSHLHPHHSFQSVPSSVVSPPPKHLQTTEEEKQLVKDIIDINNENFMHQSANHPLSLQNSSSFLITNSSSGGPLVTVTTLGNHNSNYQTGDIRHKVIASQEPATIAYNSSNQTANGNFVIINNQLSTSVDYNHQQQPAISSSTTVSSVSATGASTLSTSSSTSASSTPGRYICPYCQLNCAKPSVLQKHIRAHTNERPYPCTPCGFAFKTKSNLYKHCRSRAHIQRCNGEADLNSTLINQQNEEDGCSLESGDIDEAESSNQIETMNRLSSPSIVMESQMNGNFGENSSSSSSNSSSVAYPANSSSDTSKPYKPKFHNYKKLDLSKTSALVIPSIPPVSAVTTTSSSTPSTPSTPSFFSANAGNLTPQIIEERISRIISDNEAIIDNVEALLQKKYHKITGIQRNLSTSSGGSITNFTTTTSIASNSIETSPQSNSKLALALLKQQQQQKQHDEEILRYQMSTPQPLNLIKIQEPLSVDVGTSSMQTPRKRFLSENVAPLVITSNQQESAVSSSSMEKQQQQQQQPPAQLVIPTSHPQNPEGSIIKDLLLNSKNFGAVDGEGGDGTYTCPTCKISFRGADILKYHLICHCGDENIISRSAPMSPSSSASSPYYKNSPSSLSTLAQSQLRANIQSTSRTPSSLQKLAKSQLKVPKPKPENIVISPTISAISVKPTIIVNNHSMIKNPLPSPGPLLGNTRLVDKKSEDEFASGSKKQKLDFGSVSEKKVSPFFDVKFMHDKSTLSKNFPSGGSFIALEATESQMENNQEISPNMMRQGLSGGTALEVPIKKESQGDPPPITPKLIVTITPTLAPTLTTNTILQTSSKNHFQFPQVTVYNPLTLSLMSTSQQQQAANGAQSIVHGSRIIPYVPGIPGPNTMSIVNKNDLPPPPVPIKDKRLNSPSMKQNGIIAPPPPPREISPMPRPNGVVNKKKPFNFARIADSIDANRGGRKSPESSANVAHEELISHEQKPAKPSFLRPTSLSLKPGTFTPKQHHGITPTANTLPLISPETPRPSKSCVQLYLNGHAYTYLGLKSSTKPFYCTVNKPQPTYIQNQHKLSMYSNWQIYNGNNPNILDLSPYAAMSLYDSRQRPNKFSIADDRKDVVKLIDTQDIKFTTAIAPTNYQIQQVAIKDEQSPGGNNNIAVAANVPANVIGFESNEEYTYIRGRGRGKYICQECGIRCKKPSMLKKHIRTHTDLRPYTCSHCEFSFKTKGNLTKHMKSKAHFKKCSELGLNPIPTMPDDDLNDNDDSSSKRTSINGRDNDGSRGDSETEDVDTDDDMDDDSDDDTDESKSRMPEHEAAQLLLSLSNHATSNTRPSSANSVHMQQHLPEQQQQLQQLVLQSPHNSESWQQERTTPASTSTLEPIPRSRIIFSNTKSEFDLLSHGKYYSNPAIPRSKEMPSIPREIPAPPITEDNDDDAMPIDLTKKSQPTRSEQNQSLQQQQQQPMPQQQQHQQQRPVIVHVSDVITKISDPAVLLNQLVSNTDKIPTNQIGTSMNFTDAVQYSESFLPQEYITERALKDARIKQIQQSGKIVDYAVISALKEQRDPSIVSDESQAFAPKSTQQQPSPQQHQQQQLQQQPKVNSNGMMDALAELASKSDKLEIKGDESKPSAVNNAKNVASEYLKLTQQKLTTQRATEEGDAGSDQETQEPQVKLLAPQTIVVGEDGFHKKAPNSTVYNNDPLLYSHLQDDSGRPVCIVCSKVFQKASQLKIHMNIHYMERKFRCEACGVSFRTQGHLQKHERSVSHQNKVNMSSTFGVPSVSNPRPFKCKDCKIAFRIHGHLAKHLRSKMHVLKLECLQKLPFGTYAEMERAGFNLTDIDTSDCDNSLMSLRALAKKLNEKDPSKLGPLPPLSNDDSIDGDESGMNDNYDSDSSDAGVISNHINDEDASGGVKRKIDDSDVEILKRIKLTTTATIESDCSQVPSNHNPIDDDKARLTCAKN